MSGYLFLIFAAFAVVAMLLFSVAPGAWAETYSSTNSKYPEKFGDDIFGTLGNDLQYMDVVYFGGKEIIFFTLLSTWSPSEDSKLFYYHDSSDGHAIDIGNSQSRDYRIKTCVFNNVLYVFYGSTNSSTIRYRTATVDRGADGDGWKLVFSGEKTFSGGVSAYLRMAVWMDETMYVIYTSGSNWYYAKTTDGLNFSPGGLFFTGGPIQGAGGAVFQVPTADSFTDKLMISYATGTALKYFFFDGTSSYGLNTAAIVSNTSPYSVRLIAGTATNYSDSRYSIQVFYSSPKDNSSQKWSSIYHREYYPSGANGELGLWSSQWTRLSNSSDDTVFSYAYDSDFYWAVIPWFQNEGANVRMLIRLWYHRGTRYVWPSTNWIDFRRSVYNSDLLAYSTTNTVDPSSQDLTTSTILGVIEGTPPFPENKEVPKEAGYKVSNVLMNYSTTLDTSTNWSVGGSVVVSYGRSFLKGGGFQSKLSGGLKYTKETKNSSTSTTGLTFSSYPDVPPGDLGWVLVLKPEIINDQYVLRSWNGNLLAYDGDSSREFTASTIVYGDDTTIESYQYYLEDPPKPFGEDDTTTEIFRGMEPRHLSTDVCYWKTVVDTLSPSYKVFLNEAGANPLLKFWGNLGTLVTVSKTETTAKGETWSPSAGFTASASKLGFGIEGSVSFSMDIKTTTTMTKALGFEYHLPACPQPIVGYTCISHVDIEPFLLIPNGDDSGYDSPWISDDIRNFRKPKPWALTYRSTPNINCATNVAAARLSLLKAQGAVFLDLEELNRDRMSANFTLTGIAPGFVLDAEQFLRLWLGNYAIDSETNYVVARYARGNHLYLQLRESEDSESLIQIRLTYDAAKSQLDIKLDADHIDLTPLYAHAFLGGEEPSGAEAEILPLDLHVGERYFVTSQLGLKCADNAQNVICNFQNKKRRLQSSP
jgi:hypothetical protein